MTLDTKIELIRYKILHQRYGFNFEILDTIPYLKDEISHIDERSFSFDINAENDNITATRFIKYMDEFAECMKENFYNINCFHYILQIIVIGNKEELNKLLQYADGDNHFYTIKKDSEIMEWIYKLIIGSFIKNAKFVPSIEEFLKENKIKLKEVGQYNIKECKMILKLLSDLVLCLRGSADSFYLFQNIDIEMEEYLNSKRNRRGRKRTLEDLKIQFINERNQSYEKIFKAYNDRKEYLKFFM